MVTFVLLSAERLCPTSYLGIDPTSSPFSLVESGVRFCSWLVGRGRSWGMISYVCCRLLYFSLEGVL